MQMNQRLSGARGRLGRSSLGSASRDWTEGLDDYFDFQTGDSSFLILTDTWPGGLVQNTLGNFVSRAANEIAMTDLGLQTVPTRTNNIPYSIPNNGFRTITSIGDSAPISGSTYVYATASETNVNGSCIVTQTISQTPGIYTVSAYCKKGNDSGHMSIRIQNALNQASEVRVWFNPITGVLHSGG